jgi:hypothetical protein
VFILLVALAAALIGYTALINAADRFLAPALPEAAASLPGAQGLVVATLLALGALTVLSHPRSNGASRAANSMRARLYTLAVTAAHVPLTPSLPASADLQPASSLAVSQLSGARA